MVGLMATRSNRALPQAVGSGSCSQGPPCGWPSVPPQGSQPQVWLSFLQYSVPLQHSCLERPTNSMKRQKDGILKDELPRLVGAQYATGEEQRNNSRKNEETEPQWKQHPVVDVTGDGSKVWCCKEQYCIRTWNVRSMNQGKSEVVKQEMARVNQYFRKSVN